MDEDQHGGVTDDGFTKEQQDVYFQEERCPFCRSEELLFASRERRECGRTEAREVFCDECEEEWVEVYYRDVGTSFLLKPDEAEAYFDDEDEGDPDDDDDDDDAADVSVTAASADT